jgi:phosphate transport system permease protein
MDARRTDRIATAVFWAIGIVALGILAFIVIEIFIRGFMTAINPSFFAGKPEALKEGGGIGPMIVSTLYLTFLTMLIALPISVGAAIYMSEFAHEGRFPRFIRFCLDSLGTVPSIVFALFGMTLFLFYLDWRTCLLAGAITMALLNLPVLLRSSEEALRLVPRTYREASMSLGASRWITVKKVVLPTALPGIITGTILPLGRIMGESAVVIFTVGVFVRSIPISPFDPAAPLAGYIWYVQSEAIVPDYRAIVNGGAAVLLILLFVINFGTRWLSKYYSKRKSLGG